MPSPRFPRSRNPTPGLPPRARELAEKIADGLTWKEAAAEMRIGLKTASTYRNLPMFNAYHRKCLEDVRNGERGKNLKAAVEIRDDTGMAKSAAGNRARLEAARFIEGRDGGITINNTVGMSVGGITPGYMVVIPHEFEKESRRLLREAGSTKAIDLQKRDGSWSDPQMPDESI